MRAGTIVGAAGVVSTSFRPACRAVCAVPAVNAGCATISTSRTVCAYGTVGAGVSSFAAGAVRTAGVSALTACTTVLAEDAAPAAMAGEAAATGDIREDVITKRETSVTGSIEYVLDGCVLSKGRTQFYRSALAGCRKSPRSHLKVYDFIGNGSYLCCLQLLINDVGIASGFLDLSHFLSWYLMNILILSCILKRKGGHGVFAEFPE